MWKCVAILSLFVLAARGASTDASKEENALWNEDAVKELREECTKGSDVSCIKLKVVEVMEGILKKDSFKISETMSVVVNQPAVLEEQKQEEASETSSRSSSESWVSRIERYLRTHDVRLDTPAGQLTLSPRRLNDGRVDLSLQFDGDDEDIGEQGRSKLKKKLKKSKLKKILVPVAILMLLKAMTVIPLVLGILGVKAWNALQLSFGSFVVSLALAVFQLCQKLARDSPPSAPQLVAAHSSGWEASARTIQHPDFLAYRAHKP